MTRLLPLLLIIAACSSRNVPAKGGDYVEADSPVSVHPDVDGDVRYVEHTTRETPDGRLAIRVVLASQSGKDVVLVAYTDWFDAEGNVIERSNARTIVLPSGQTYLYEDSAYSAEAARFGVAIRPATTKRKR